MQNPTVVFARPREAVIEPRPMPRAAAGELLIETIVSLISTGTELTILAGEYPDHSVWSRYGRLPFVAGYSNVGRVAEVGEGVDRTWLGRRVATRTPHAAWVTARPAAAAAIPDAISDEPAALFALAAIVMNGVRRSRLTWGETAIVYGLGLLGQLAVRFAERAGAHRIFAVDVAEQRLALLPRSPAIVAVDAGRVDVRAKVRDLNRGRLADVAFEVTGDAKLIAGEIRALAPQGRFVMLSSPRGLSTFDFHDLCNAPSYTIIGAHEMSHPPAETPANPWTHLRHNELYFDYLAERTIDVAPLLSHRIPFDRAPAAYADLLADRSRFMGVILDWRRAMPA